VCAFRYIITTDAASSSDGYPALTFNMTRNDVGTGSIYFNGASEVWSGADDQGSPNGVSMGRKGDLSNTALTEITDPDCVALLAILGPTDWVIVDIDSAGNELWLAFASDCPPVNPGQWGVRGHDPGGGSLPRNIISITTAMS